MHLNIKASFKAPIGDVFDVLWQSVEPRLHGKLENLSVVPCGKGIGVSAARKVRPDKVCDFLRQFSSLDSFIISYGEGREGSALSLSYSSVRGPMSLLLSDSIAVLNVDEIVSGWFSSFRITNILAGSLEYSAKHAANRNPGANDLLKFPCFQNHKVGYVEGVTAEMWLGEGFWEFSSCSKIKCMAQDWLHVEERKTHLYVRAWPRPFATNEGEEMLVQRRLLRLFFESGIKMEK